MKNPTPPNHSKTFLQNRSAKIKHVLIQTKNYGFYHSPFSKEASGRKRSKGEKNKLYDNRFIGRNKARKKIINILKNSSTQSGTYLVAGFRGMGKTSLVRMGIDEYNYTYGFPEPDKVGQDNGSGLDRLKNVLTLSALKGLVAAALLLFLALLTLPLWADDHLGRDIWWDNYLCRYVETVNWLGIIIVSILVPYLLLCFAYWIIDHVQDFSISRFWSWIKRGIGYTISFPWKNSNTPPSTLKKALTYLVSDIKQRQSRYKRFEISLAEDKISEENILKRITINLLEYWRDLAIGQRKSWYKRPIFRPIQKVLSLFAKEERTATFENIEFALETLSQRIVSKVSDQSGGANSPTLSVGGSSLLGRFGLPFKFGGGQRALNYDVATPKEIEEELILILKNIDDFRKNEKSIKIPRFLFIIDELDKIEVPGLNSPTNENDARNNYDPIYTPDSTLTRRRQQALAILLGNMKNFLNVVRAKFFFIGGRELYEASLADIADRDSFYSSIFNQTIYIESFLKDKSSPRAGITQMTENYLCNLILGDLTREDLKFNRGVPSLTLKNVFNSLHPSSNSGICIGEEDHSAKSWTPEQIMMRYKIIFLLQNYIIYLTYRSNGTPKKLTSLIEDIIVSTNAVETLDKSSGEYEIDPKENLTVCRQDLNSAPGQTQFLRFRFDFQYEVALTSEIYRPFLIINSRHIKALGDKLLFSSPFIFDHILKFHSYGFSWRHLV